jgi:isoquinoline 1-oxidoreductase alpha subunit
MKLNVNGEEHDLAGVDRNMPLLWALRDRLELTGTKYGCGRAQCGACTVHVNGEAVRSCSMLMRDAEGKRVVTIEAVSGPVADAVRAAWQRLDVVQCGYCQSGQIMTAISLLSSIKRPTDADIDAAMDGNICRCGTYQRIRKAIHEAARALSRQAAR